MDDFKWFIALLVVLGALWLGGRGSGPARRPAPAATTAPAQNSVPPPLMQPTPQVPRVEAEIDEFPPAGTIISETTLPEPPLEIPNSPLRGRLIIASASRGPFEREYVVIQALRAGAPVQLTGLVIRSGVTRVAQTIGEGWPLYFPGTTKGTESIVLNPGERAYLLSGRSPLFGGYAPFPNQGSFRLNRCTGYLEQGLDFYPKLPLSCPQPARDPLPLPPNNLSEECYDYLKTLKRCVVPSSVPEKLRTDGSCQAHIFNRINYNQCVLYYKDEPGFFGGEWRIYLGRSTELWRDKREIIELLDAEGRLIDARTY